MGWYYLQGELELNFYSESDQLPEYPEQFIAPDSSIKYEFLSIGETKHSVHHMHSRILLRCYTAKAGMEWLKNTIALLKNEQETFLLPSFDDDFHQ